MEGLQTKPQMSCKKQLQKSRLHDALLDQCFTLYLVPPGVWPACHPAQGDSPFTQVQPPDQELVWDRAPRLLLPCPFGLLGDLLRGQVPAPDIAVRTSHRQHNCTRALQQPCPVGTLEELKDPTCISSWATSLPPSCSHWSQSQQQPCLAGEAASKPGPFSASRCVSRDKSPGSSAAHHSHGQTRVSRLLSSCLTCNKAAAVQNQTPSSPSLPSQLAAKCPPP